MPGIGKKTLQIEGMTCTNCENRIERALQNTPGVLHARVSYSTGKADIEFDEGVISLGAIEKRIEQLDYKVKKAISPSGKSGNYTHALGAAFIIFALYTAINRFGLSNIFNQFPEAEKGMGYGMLFIIGMLTSVHCVAMCGGINLSQCAAFQSEDGSTGGFSALRPSLLYNLGRVISYTAIGAIVGAAGSVISFSGAAKGIVQLVAGVFMIIMGLNMLNLFPWLRRLNPRMPKIFAKKINAQKNGNSPLYVGLLNGLMPCGPLQAMQLYALSTGSAVSGAISMFLFSLGTVPLMFGLGALSSFLSKKFTGKMMTVSAVLVVVLGTFMFSSGLSLSGFAVSPDAINSQSGNVAKTQDGVQTVTTQLSPGRYEQIVVQKGIPVRWVIQAEAGSINGCNNRIIIPKYDLQKKLEPGENIIEFTPTENGTIPYSCWMGMIRSSIVVVDGADGTAPANPDDAVSPNPDDLPGYTDPLAPDINFSDYKIPTEEIAVAQIKDGEQSVSINMDGAQFFPAVVVMQKGLQTTWTINGAGLTDSNSILLFPYYFAQLEMAEGENYVYLLPDADFDFSTQDSSFYGYVKVVDDINAVDLDAIRQEVEQYTPQIWDFSQNDGLPSCH